ncbi:hypothetical protein [Nannocystis pusilla]|uniref:Uncharacterized protein n=1 Tax=Nannocystis pusilla TaxID=889268 RepID=A0ABS7TQR7_9BACT|nr:hypothetical protein [Nannocystis pusilla]MBZ5710578.1 hypothetical protein [Nannocystis pusilla]
MNETQCCTDIATRRAVVRPHVADTAVWFAAVSTEVTAWRKWDCTRCGQRDISGRDSEVVTGEGHDSLRFAEIATAGALERTVQSGAYAVVFSYGDDGETYTRDTPRAEYDGWQAGEDVLVSVDHLHGPTGVRRPNERP